jgi:hypothetical protein
MIRSPFSKCILPALFQSPNQDALFHIPEPENKSMNAKKTLLALLIAAALALVCLPAGQLFAQFGEDGDDQLQVVVNKGDASNEQRLATYRGVAEPLSLRPGQWFPVTLQFPVGIAGTTIRVGCLDGGQISVSAAQGQVILPADGTPQPTLSVAADGTMPLSFQAGQTPGLYRVVVQLADKRYYLHFYLVDPSRPAHAVAP